MSFTKLKTGMQALFILISLILLPLMILILMSPGRAEQITDNHGNPLTGTISEKIFIEINGVRQGMFIRSKKAGNPVLLYLHGGIPDYFLSRRYPDLLEDYFTVVWWEQRGSGLSYDSGISGETMNLDQMISDTREVTNYLRARFGQEKIYLLGRSGGSFIGIRAAETSPELYHAYIGVGQMSDQLVSERLSYEYMVKQFSEAGNRKMVRKLTRYPVTDTIPFGYLKLRDQAMHNLGIGTTHDMKSIITGIFIPSLTCREYTVREKINLWRGKARSGVHPLWNTILATDLSQQVDELKVPVYFLHGIYDYTVSYPLARRFYESLKAPLKGFYTFDHSAHSPLFEEPDAVREIIENDILKGGYSLADIR